MRNKNLLPYEANITAQYPFLEAGNIGRRDRLRDDPGWIGNFANDVYNIISKRQSKRCHPCSDISTDIQVNYALMKFDEEIRLHSEHYSHLSRMELECAKKRIEILKCTLSNEKWIKLNHRNLATP